MTTPAWVADAELLRAVDEASLLSLDIFDTLLFRVVAHPHDVFLDVARRAHARGLLPAHVKPEHLRALRVGAEQRARALKANGAAAEVTLDDIWAAMPASFADTRAAMAALEVDAEADLCFRNPVIWDLVMRARERGIPVVLVSDMYLSRGHLEALLERCNCPPRVFAAILVSSEGLGAKWDGRMFGRLQHWFPEIAPASMLHIGDNRRSDVEQAEAAGLRACHFDCSSALVDEVERLEHVHRVPGTSALRSFRRLALAAREPAADETRWWFEFGATVLGPFLSGFSDWVVDQCIADHVAVIRPLTREGYLLTRMIRAAADTRRLPIDVAALPASRRSTWLAGLDRFDDLAVDELCLNDRLTVAEALALLGQRDVPAALDGYRDVRLSADDDEKGAEALFALRTHLKRADVRHAVDQTIREQRTVVRRFLNAARGGASRVALVDLGFRATTGRALERIANLRPAATWHHFLALGADSVDSAWFAGSDIRVFAGGPGADALIVPTIVRHAAVLEALLVSGESTVAYEESPQGGVTAVIENARVPAAQLELIAACHAGAMAFQRVWLNYRALKNMKAEGLGSGSQLSTGIWRLIEHPSIAEAEHLGALVHEHNGGSSAAERLCEVSALPQGIEASEFLAHARDGNRAWHRRWLWPQGIVARQQADGLATEGGVRSASSDRTTSFEQLAARMASAGVNVCLVYGAGEAGRALAAALSTVRIEVRAFVDRNQALWGTAVAGRPVISLSQAVAGTCHIYAIGSLAFADQIRADLTQAYHAAGLDFTAHGARRSVPDAA